MYSNAFLRFICLKEFYMPCFPLSVDKSFKASARCLREMCFCRHGFRATARKVYEEETSKIKQNILVSNVLTLKLYLVRKQLC